MHNKISIMIADDHLLFIDGLVLLLNNEPDLQVIEVANDGKELLECIKQTEPDLVLLDINMPKLNGLDTARYIKQSNPNIKVIMLSTYNEDHLVEKAKSYGANGYLLKNSSKAELLQTIRLVAEGKSCFPYRLPREPTGFDGNDQFLKSFNLTKRETEILGLIKQNLTNKLIAEKLFLSVYTIETHRKNIMQKLGLGTPGALMKFIIEHNL
ncbi:MAG: response regulator transcription factor [Chitinophagaceae bacterium]|nr:response regulator transcription factor [Chitinophagaceae bacterium]